MPRPPFHLLTCAAMVVAFAAPAHALAADAKPLPVPVPEGANVVDVVDDFLPEDDGSGDAVDPTELDCSDESFRAAVVRTTADDATALDSEDGDATGDTEVADDTGDDCSEVTDDELGDDDQADADAVTSRTAKAGKIVGRMLNAGRLKAKVPGTLDVTVTLRDGTVAGSGRQVVSRHGIVVMRVKLNGAGAKALTKGRRKLRVKATVRVAGKVEQTYRHTITAGTAKKAAARKKAVVKKGK